MKVFNLLGDDWDLLGEREGYRKGERLLMVRRGEQLDYWDGEP